MKYGMEVSTDKAEHDDVNLGLQMTGLQYIHTA